VTQPDQSFHLISISRLARVGAVEVSIQRFRGTVRESTLEDFRKRLAEAGERAPFLIVDLSETEYMSSTGLGLILGQAGIQEARGGWLRVVAPSPAVSMILRLSGVSETLPSWRDEAEALRDLAPRAA
jgi:stage II sporulation protein AA (anti-sigma F factor antagonist)